ncbi:Sensor kinase CckA [bacterium HR29]|jgi:signal transduction histidine kinase|nr:Sensor kinase CckA [bacterium HR29]
MAASVRAWLGRIQREQAVGAHILVGILWVIGSVSVVYAMPEAGTRASVWLANGLAYVLLTGLMLHGLVRRSLNDLRSAHDELLQAYQEIERFATLARSAPEPILVLSAGGELEYRNGAADRLVASAGLSGPLELLGPQGLEAALRTLGSTLPSTPVEVRVGERVFHWSFAANREVGVVACFGADITALREMTDRALEAEYAEQRERMFAGLAHDLRNILTAVRGYADLMFPALPPDDRVRSDLSEMIRAIEIAHGLLQRFTGAFRRSARRDSVIDLREEVAGMEPLLKHSVSRNVELRLSVERERIPVRLDPGQLLRALLNLVSNAVDAIGDQPGHIDISVRREVWNGTPYGSVYVTDDGCGMDEETRARAFEAFFTTKDGRGTGLGLTAVRGVVEQARGTVELVSAPGRGTTVVMRFPVSAASESSPSLT